MLVNRIGFNNSVLPFSGNSRKKDVNKDKIIVIQPSASDKAANKAIKTLLISALMTSPAVINTSCDKWTEEDFSHWENENPAHYKDYVYIIPSRKVDGIMLPTDSVEIKHGFAVNDNLNKNLNNMLNKLNIPRMTEGELPVSMSWLGDGSSRHVTHMLLDGDASKDGKYVYNVTKYSNSGNEQKYTYTFSDNGSKVNLSVNSNGVTSEYTLADDGNEIACYKNTDGEDIKCAVFCESKLPNENGAKAHCIVKESFDENGETSDLAVMSNFDLWSYTPDKL